MQCASKPIIEQLTQLKNCPSYAKAFRLDKGGTYGRSSIKSTQYSQQSKSSLDMSTFQCSKSQQASCLNTSQQSQSQRPPPLNDLGHTPIKKQSQP